MLDPGRTQQQLVMTSPSPSAMSTTSTGQPKLIHFNPKHLYFPPPLDSLITNVLTIRSGSQGCVAWKLYTTSPHRYGVKPICGFLEPGATQDVSISYKPRHQKDGGKEDPADLQNELFHIEPRVCNPDDKGRVQELFREKPAGNTVRYNIPCVFGPPGTSPARSPRGRSPNGAVNTRTPMGSPAPTPPPSARTPAAAAGTAGSSVDRQASNTFLAPQMRTQRRGNSPEPAPKSAASMQTENQALEAQVRELKKEIEAGERESASLYNSIPVADQKLLSSSSAPAASKKLEGPAVSIPLNLGVAVLLLTFFAARVLSNVADEAFC
ncbi:Vesicle-associated membrane protein/synaptobrevin-binding protein [Diplonema papillatum]|nr:Vesicle-associated membrane protein/synaptobrevin-binding protein [Diplonema papillatum]